jgi:hypothetical protein
MVPRPIQRLRKRPTLHVRWAGLRQADSRVVRGRRKLAAGARLLFGTSDAVLIGDLIRAIDTLADRCDELTSRLARQELVTSEVAGVLGEDVARLQATVASLVTPASDA